MSKGAETVDFSLWANIGRTVSEQMLYTGQRSASVR